VDIHGRTSSTIQSGNGEERTLPGLLDTIESGIRKMVRSEIELAKTEVTEAAHRARSAVLWLVAGGVLAVFAMDFLYLTAMLALELVVASWLSALIVGVMLVAAAWAGISAGRDRLKAIRPPRETMQAIREDFRSLKEQGSS